MLASAQYTGETEKAAKTKAVASAGTGASAGGLIAAEPLGQIISAVTSQQDEITSGDIVRVGIGALLIGLSVWFAFKKMK